MISSVPFCMLPCIFLAMTASLLGAESETAASWHAQSLGQAIAYLVLFSVIGIAMAIAGYKLFDWCTPGDLNKEIIENQNVAAAIVAAAVILGVCIMIAAAMVG